MNQRRRIDAQLDEGYHVELNDDYEAVAVYENRQNAVDQIVQGLQKNQDLIKEQRKALRR